MAASLLSHASEGERCGQSWESVKWKQDLLMRSEVRSKSETALQQRDMGLYGAMAENGQRLGNCDTVGFLILHGLGPEILARGNEGMDKQQTHRQTHRQ